ncbi:MAG: hypothetical protein LBE79_08110 [Tannerella sp.]|jgi:hypothetical protein|nr:hypothetical protein [Tannerella sp.]
MNKSQFKSVLTEAANNPQTIHGIFNWCDRWCERCSHTGRCTIYEASSHLPFHSPEDLFKSLSITFEATMDMVKEEAEKHGLDFESLRDSDIESEYDREKNLVRNDAGVSLAKQYGKQVKHWLDSLQRKDYISMEIRLQDPMLADCLEVIQWYQYQFEVKFTRALMAQKEEEKEQLNPYDSLGNAKLLLVSMERNMGAWGYIYQKIKEDEDEILDILICLQRLYIKIEQSFPEAKAFIRPGIDELPNYSTK